jgi:hypothetical protein
MKLKWKKLEKRKKNKKDKVHHLRKMKSQREDYLVNKKFMLNVLKMKKKEVKIFLKIN